jgi:hypothetical protein
MRSSFKNFNRWLAAFGVAAFLMVAGWQFGISGTDAVFSKTEVALENAVAKSGDPGATVPCYDSFRVGEGPYFNRVCLDTDNKINSRTSKRKNYDNLFDAY